MRHAVSGKDGTKEETGARYAKLKKENRLLGRKYPHFSYWEEYLLVVFAVPNSKHNPGLWPMFSSFTEISKRSKLRKNTFLQTYLVLKRKLSSRLSPSSVSSFGACCIFAFFRSCRLLLRRFYYFPYSPFHARLLWSLQVYWAIYKQFFKD